MLNVVSTPTSDLIERSEISPLSYRICKRLSVVPLNSDDLSWVVHKG